MTICERLFFVIDEKKLKTSELARELNIKQSVISNWKKRDTNPPVEYAVVICEFLGVTIEYYLTGKIASELTVDEKKIIEAYRKVSPEIQQIIKATLEIGRPKQDESSTSRTG